MRERFGISLSLERDHIAIYFGTPRIVDFGWIGGKWFWRTQRSKW